MKKTLMVLALVAVSGAAMAHDQVAVGSAGIGGQFTVFSGSAGGTGASVSSGNAVTSSQVNGYGSSFQHQEGFATGSASIGGAVNAGGATVGTAVTQAAQTFGTGSISGNVPIMVGDSIANGGASMSQSNNVAQGSDQFNIAAIGGSLTLAGFRSFGGSHF